MCWRVDVFGVGVLRLKRSLKFQDIKVRTKIMRLRRIVEHHQGMPATQALAMPVEGDSYSRDRERVCKSQSQDPRSSHLRSPRVGRGIYLPIKR